MPENPSAERNGDTISSKLQSELSAILSRPFYPDDDLKVYLDTSLSSIVEFADKASFEYKKRVSTDLKGGYLEDAALSHFDLPSVSVLVDALIAKQATYSEVADFLSSQEIIAESAVYVPPHEGSAFQTGSGEGVREAQVENRLRSVLFLIHDAGIPLKDIEVRRGEVKTGMVRREPYIAVTIPKLDRVVLVCDEKDNAAFVFDRSLLTTNGVHTDQLILMDKIELGSLIDTHEGIGKRILHRGTWLDRIRGSLLHPIVTNEEEARQSNESNLVPTVSRDTRDAWHGFYTDAEGKHWSTETKIFERIQLNPTHYADRFWAVFMPRPILDLRGRLRNGYCFEDIESSQLLAELRGRNFVDQGGEWHGFVEIDGVHWGTRGAIARKTDLSKPTIDAAVEKNSEKLAKRDIDSRSKDTTGYVYEEVTRIPEIRALMEAKLPLQEGDWAGFWEDPAGNHWGVITAVATKAKVSRHVVRTIIKAAGLEESDIFIRDDTGRVWPALEYESIVPKVRELLAVPQVVLEGELAGYHVDDEGRHFAHVVTLATRLGVTRSELRSILKKSKFRTMRLRSAQNNVHDAYCLEDLQAHLAE